MNLPSEARSDIVLRGCRLSCVQELDDRIEEETQDHVEIEDDDERESEIEALVGALERKEESDAIEVLATWKETRTAMAHEKLNRGLRTPVRQHSNRTPIAKHVPKPDLARLAGRISVFLLSRSWPFQSTLSKEARPSTRNDAGVRAVSCDQELPAIADVLSAHESHLEKLMKEELGNALHWNRMRQTKATSRTQKFSECAIAQVVRCWTRLARKH